MARVDLEVTPNHAPECTTFPQHTGQDDALPLTLFCTDSDQQSSGTLTYALAAPPGSRTTAATASAHTPTAGFAGIDSIHFTATDGQGLDQRDPRTCMLATTPSATRCPPARCGRGAALGDPSCTTPPSDFGSRTYTVVTPPTKGTVSVDQFFGGFTYTANNNAATGPDSFAFRLRPPRARATPQRITQAISGQPAANAAPTCNRAASRLVASSERLPLLLGATTATP